MQCYTLEIFPEVSVFQLNVNGFGHVAKFVCYVVVVTV